MISNGAPVPFIAEIMDVVSASFPKLTRADLVGPNRARKFSRPRQIAMALARELTQRSMPEIGRQFSRDHTTVLHAIRRVHYFCATDPEFDRAVERLRSAIARSIVDEITGARLQPLELRRPALGRARRGPVLPAALARSLPLRARLRVAPRNQRGRVMAKLTEAQIDQIVALGERGKSGAQVAAITGLPEATVNYRLLRNGIDPWPKHASHRRQYHPGAFSADEDARMLELAKTLPIYHVARAMGRAPTSVRIRLMTLEIRAEKALEAAA